MEQKGYRCGLYLRVSTDLQANTKEGSLMEQERRLRANIDSRPRAENWSVVDVYCEKGKSGKNMERPELQRLLVDIQSDRINCVIITKLDRLTRSLLDFYRIYQSFEKYGTNFVAIDESFDTSTATGRAMLKITLVFAELERERTGERTRSTLLTRAQKGLWNGRQVLGYDLDPNDKGTLKVNAEEAELVAEIFRTYLEKGAVKGTAALLNQRGLRTKAYLSRREHQQGGRRFNDSHVRNILKDVTYVGQIRYAKQVFNGLHQPIIDRATFDKVQELLASNTRTRHNTIAPTSHTFILMGLLRCGKCGSTMTPHDTVKKKRSYHYYQCSALDHRGKDACSLQRISADLVEPVVIQAIREFSRRPAFVRQVVAEVNRAVQEALPKLQRKRARMLRSKSDIGSEVKKIIDAFVVGTHVSRAIQARIDELDQQLAATDLEIKQVDDQIRQEENRTVNAQIVVEILAQFDRVWDAMTPAEQKDLVRLLVNQIVYDGQTIKVAIIEGKEIEKALPRKPGKPDPSGPEGRNRKAHTKQNEDQGEDLGSEAGFRFRVNETPTMGLHKRNPGNLNYHTVTSLPGECSGSSGGI